MATIGDKPKASPIFLRVGEEEKNDIEYMARITGVSMSSWLRMKIREVLKLEFDKLGQTPSFLKADTKPKKSRKPSMKDES